MIKATTSGLASATPAWQKIQYRNVDNIFKLYSPSRNNNLNEKKIFRSERIEKKRLEKVAQYILVSVHQSELLVMGYFNGTVQFFGITHQQSKEIKPSRFTSWLEVIPGVKNIKNWYNKMIEKSRNYFTRKSTINLKL